MADTINFGIEKPTVGGYRNVWGGTINTALDKLTELLALALPIGTIQMYTKSTPPAATASGGTWLVCDGSTKVRTDYPDLHTIITNTYGAYPSASTFVLPDLRARVPVGYNAGTLGSGPTARTGKAIAASSGEENHILSEAELEQHSHSLPNTTHTHPITDVNHSHAGANSGSTEPATLTITDDGHFHDTPHVKSWGSSAAGYKPEWGPGPEVVNVSSDPKTTGITIADHKHSFTTTSVGTGLTATQPALTGITVTGNTGSNTAHNNMPPYQVVNYIILAKHPSF